MGDDFLQGAAEELRRVAGTHGREVVSSADDIVSAGGRSALKFLGGESRASAGQRRGIHLFKVLTSLDRYADRIRVPEVDGLSDFEILHLRDRERKTGFAVAINKGGLTCLDWVHSVGVDYQKFLGLVSLSFNVGPTGGSYRLRQFSTPGRDEVGVWASLESFDGDWLPVAPPAHLTLELFASEIAPVQQSGSHMPPSKAFFRATSGIYRLAGGSWSFAAGDLPDSIRDSHGVRVEADCPAWRGFSEVIMRLCEASVATVGSGERSLRVLGCGRNSSVIEHYAKRVAEDPVLLLDPFSPANIAALGLSRSGVRKVSVLNQQAAAGETDVRARVAVSSAIAVLALNGIGPLQSNDMGCWSRSVAGWRNVSATVAGVDFDVPTLLPAVEVAASGQDLFLVKDGKLSGVRFHGTDRWHQTFLSPDPLKAAAIQTVGHASYRPERPETWKAAGWLKGSVAGEWTLHKQLGPLPVAWGSLGLLRDEMRHSDKGDASGPTRNRGHPGGGGSCLQP
eukprot:g15217.t1